MTSILPDQPFRKEQWIRKGRWINKDSRDLGDELVCEDANYLKRAWRLGKEFLNRNEVGAIWVMKLYPSLDFVVGDPSGVKRQDKYSPLKRVHVYATPWHTQGGEAFSRELASFGVKPWGIVAHPHRDNYVPKGTLSEKHLIHLREVAIRRNNSSPSLLITNSSGHVSVSSLEGDGYRSPREKQLAYLLEVADRRCSLELASLVGQLGTQNEGAEWLLPHEVQKIRDTFVAIDECDRLAGREVPERERFPWVLRKLKRVAEEWYQERIALASSLAEVRLLCGEKNQLLWGEKNREKEIADAAGEASKDSFGLLEVEALDDQGKGGVTEDIAELSEGDAFEELVSCENLATSVRERQLLYLLELGNASGDEGLGQLVGELGVNGECSELSQAEIVSVLEYLSRSGYKDVPFVERALRSIAEEYGSFPFLGLSPVQSYKNGGGVTEGIDGEFKGGLEAELSAFSRGEGVSGEGERRPKRQGQKGITPYGRRMVRSGVAVMEKKYGRDNIGMATLTLPVLSEQEHELVCEEFSSAINRFMCWFRAALRTAVASKGGVAGESGLPAYVYCVELQEKRAQKYGDGGKPFPHLHILFLCRPPESSHKKGDWYLSKEAIQEGWRRALSRTLDREIDPQEFKSATRVEKVRSSAINYVGKYLSKGSSSCSKVVEKGNGHLLPKRWWGMSEGLAAEVKRRIVEYRRGEANDFIRMLPELKAEGVLECREVVVELRGAPKGDFPDEEGDSETPVAKRVVGYHGYFLVPDVRPYLLQNSVQLRRLLRRRRRAIERLKRRTSSSSTRASPAEGEVELLKRRLLTGGARASPPNGGEV